MRHMDKPLRELARGLRAREFTPSDLLREAAERVHLTEARLNAYKAWGGARAECAARAADEAFQRGAELGALQGIPVSVKDLYVVPGYPTFAGTPREMPPPFQSPGPLVASLVEQLAVITGKTHTVEFAYGGSGLNRHWETPRNPWDATHHRVPGGSSSGAGVSLCQGSALIAFGSDTGGSVRVPASVTGNVAYKPTIGRWSTRGIMPLSPLFDSPGILARSADDAFFAAVALDRASPGAAPPLADRICGERPRLRIGIPENVLWESCEAGIAESVRAALDELARAGHQLVSIAFPEADGAFDVFRAGGTSGAELLAFLQESLPEWIPLLDPFIAARIERSAHIPATEFLRRTIRLEALAAAAHARFDSVDVIACPTVAISPPRMDEIAAMDAYLKASLAMVRNTCPANLLGLTAMTLPVGLDANRMPVGLQIMARAHRDDLLLAAGLEIERVLGTGAARLGAPPGP